MSNEKNALIRVENLTKHFVSKPSTIGGKPLVVKAVNNVSFSILEGKPWAWWGNPAAASPPPAGC